MTETSKIALGIDVGGTGIKGALVDLTTGTLASERFRLDTPQPALPADVAEVIIAVADHFDFAGPTGVAFPGVVLDGVVHTAANLHRDWIGVDLADLVGSRLRGPSVFLTDADAAGLAEAHFGAAKGTDGVVVIVALGTGIGVAMINDGRLVANSELGHLELDGVDAETYAAASARQRNGHTWQEWGAHANHPGSQVTIRCDFVDDSVRLLVTIQMLLLDGSDPTDSADIARRGTFAMSVSQGAKMNQGLEICRGSHQRDGGPLAC